MRTDPAELSGTYKIPILYLCVIFLPILSISLSLSPSLSLLSIIYLSIYLSIYLLPPLFTGLVSTYHCTGWRDGRDDLTNPASPRVTGSATQWPAVRG